MFQLDEEIEAMQAALLQLEQQGKGSNTKDSAHQSVIASPSKSGGTRERTARGTPNGPVDTHNSTSNGGSSMSSKVASRSQT